MSADHKLFSLKFNNIPTRALSVNAWVAILLLALYNMTFWQKLANEYPVVWQNLPFMISGACLLFCFYYLVLTLISWKFVLRPLLLLILILAAISAYAMDTFGYVISTNAFENLAASDSHEMYDLLSVKLGVYICGLLVLPIFLLFKLNLSYPSIKRRCVFVGVLLLLMLINIAIFNKTYTSFLRNHKHVRYYINPMRPIYALGKFVWQSVHDNTNQQFIVLDDKPVLSAHNGKPRLVVLIVGESDRAINHQLNGYVRPTNPLLALHNDVFSFTQVTSCGTETSVSVPCMFSSFTRDEYTYAKGRNTENVLDLLQKSQVNVLWRDNDSGCKGVCDRVTTHDFNQAKIDPFCNSFECHDEVLLHELQNYIDQNPGDKLIVLHKLGNHGPAYYKRYPQQFEKFTPTCKSNELQDCTDAEIVNTYDNIILYTDYMIDKVIKQLKTNNSKYQTALIYLSDHGESLGEKGIYLHAMPYWLAPKEQTHIPFIFWASPDFGISKQTLSKMQHQSYSHDNLFHTLLGLFKVQSKVYVKELDMFGTTHK